MCGKFSLLICETKNIFQLFCSDGKVRKSINQYGVNLIVGNYYLVDIDDDTIEDETKLCNVMCSIEPHDWFIYMCEQQKYKNKII